MFDIDNGPSKISVSKICLFRKGSDIDLEAIFGGRISTKKKDDVKRNPVYKEGQNLKRSDNDMGGIEIQVYRNIPPAENSHVKNVKMKEILTKENSREKVTVTNGDVCVGDIIIENGFRNPAFDSDSENGDHSEILEHTLKYTGEGQGKDNMSGSGWPNLDQIALPSSGDLTTMDKDDSYETIDYNRNTTTKLKDQLDPGDKHLSNDNISYPEQPENTQNNESQSPINETISNNIDIPNNVSQTQTRDMEPQTQTKDVEPQTSMIEIVSNDETNDEGQINHENLHKDDLNTDCSCKPQSDIVQSEHSETPNEEMTDNSTNHEQISSQNSEITNIITEDQSTDENVNSSTDKNSNEDSGTKNGTIVEKGEKLNGSVRSDISIEDLQPGKDKSKKKNKKQKQRKNSLPDYILNSLNMKPAKPILVPVVIDDCINREKSGDNEQKSVKFSDDTVFNDHKPNKYKQDRVSQKELYKGKISSKEAVAKLNPMFVDENNQGITDSNNQNDLNTPAYMKDFVIKQGTSVRRPGLEVDNDIESIGSEGAVNYDKLIERTIARKRRSRILRVTCALFTFCVVIGIVVVLVIFVGKK